MTQRPPGNNGAHACLVSRLQQLARSRQGIAWGGRLACDGAGLCAAVTVARLAIAPSKTRSKAALVADFLAATIVAPPQGVTPPPCPLCCVPELAP
jgi:hypothetical protein